MHTTFLHMDQQLDSQRASKHQPPASVLQHSAGGLDNTACVLPAQGEGSGAAAVKMSFSWTDYKQELKAVVTGWWPTTWAKRIAHRTFYRQSFAEVMAEKREAGGAEMKRTLTGLDLLMFGVGAPPHCSANPPTIPPDWSHNTPETASTLYGNLSASCVLLKAAASCRTMSSSFILPFGDQLCLQQSECGAHVAQVLFWVLECLSSLRRWPRTMPGDPISSITADTSGCCSFSLHSQPPSCLFLKLLRAQTCAGLPPSCLMPSLGFLLCCPPSVMLSTLWTTPLLEAPSPSSHSPMASFVAGAFNSHQP